MSVSPFKTLSLQQIEDGFAGVIAGLTGATTRIDLERIDHVTDGVDRLVGQQRYKVCITLLVQEVEEADRLP